MDATLKDDDRSADVTIETMFWRAQDQRLSLRIDWKQKLRNLKYESPAYKLYKMGDKALCQATSQYVNTMDNVTYTYIPKLLH